MDTLTVLLLLCSFGVIEWQYFSTLLINGYLFKVIIAALDTPFIYVTVWWMRRYFGLEGHGAELEF